MTHIRIYSTQTTALTNEWTMCNEEHIERSLYMLSPSNWDPPQKGQRMLIALPNLGGKKKGRNKERKERKGESSNQNPCFFYLRSSKCISISFCKEYFCFYFVFPKPYSWKWSRNEFITSSMWWFWLNCTIGIYRNRISIIRVSLIKCAHFSGDRQRLPSLLSWALCTHPESYIVKLF